MKFPIALAVVSLCATAAIAQTPAAPTPPAAPKATATVASSARTTVAKTSTTTKTTTPATIAVSTKKPRAKAAPAADGRMVSTKLANGKTVTYNCALAGNRTKQACK